VSINILLFGFILSSFVLDVHVFGAITF